MIDVRLFATLPLRSATGRKEFQIEARPALTVGEIVAAEGLAVGEVHIVMLNGVHGTLDSLVVDGDRVGLFPPIGGG
jgi:molybdopterin converting factor small subunit